MVAVALVVAVDVLADVGVVLEVADGLLEQVDSLVDVVGGVDDLVGDGVVVGRLGTLGVPQHTQEGVCDILEVAVLEVEVDSLEANGGV